MATIRAWRQHGHAKGGLATFPPLRNPPSLPEPASSGLRCWRQHLQTTRSDVFPGFLASGPASAFPRRRCVRPAGDQKLDWLWTNFHNRGWRRRGEEERAERASWGGTRGVGALCGGQMFPSCCCCCSTRGWGEELSGTARKPMVLPARREESDGELEAALLTERERRGGVGGGGEERRRRGEGRRRGESSSLRRRRLTTTTAAAGAGGAAAAELTHTHTYTHTGRRQEKKKKKKLGQTNWFREVDWRSESAAVPPGYCSQAGAGEGGKGGGACVSRCNHLDRKKRKHVVSQEDRKEPGL